MLNSVISYLSLLAIHLGILLTVSSCATRVVVVHPGEDVWIDVRMVETEVESEGKKRHIALLKIYEFSDLPGFVNEIYMDDGNYTLVEYFDTIDGALAPGQSDRHSIGHLSGTHKRWIYTYPAEVEGVDATPSGFAELPQNKDGSVVTNTNPETFNTEHNASYSRKGRIVRDERERGRWWSMYYHAPSNTIKIVLDDKPSFAR